VEREPQVVPQAPTESVLVSVPVVVVVVVGVPDWALLALTKGLVQAQVAAGAEAHPERTGSAGVPGGR
jgi:heme/copper-type cytochrome/quinol oxidase subunit 2